MLNINVITCMDDVENFDEWDELCMHGILCFNGIMS